MKIETKTRNLIIGVFIGLIALFGLGWYFGMSRERSSWNIDRNVIKAEIKRLQFKLDSTTYYVSKVQQELTTQRELVRQGELDKKYLKGLNIKQANEISMLTFRVDTLIQDVTHNGYIIDYAYSVTQNMKSQIDSLKRQKAILLPFSFHKIDKWLTLRGDFDKDGALSTRLSMDIEVDVVTGISKDKQPVCAVTTTNPYIQTVNVQSYKFDSHKPTKFGIGFQIGWGLQFANQKPQLSPYIGVGVSRNIIRW